MGCCHLTGVLLEMPPTSGRLPHLAARKLQGAAKKLMAFSLG
jgi:hypothetical protein